MQLGINREPDAVEIELEAIEFFCMTMFQLVPVPVLLKTQTLSHVRT